MSKSEMIWKQYKDIVKLKAEARKNDALVIDMGAEIDRLTQVLDARDAEIEEYSRLRNQRDEFKKCYYRQVDYVKFLSKEADQFKGHIDDQNRIIQELREKNTRLEKARIEAVNENHRLAAIIKDLEGVHRAVGNVNAYEVKT